MVKKCVYCSVRVDEYSVVDMCEGCMYQVWGDKMAKAIITNMEKERDKGNLELGDVSGASNIRELVGVKKEFGEIVSDIEIDGEEEEFVFKKGF